MFNIDFNDEKYLLKLLDASGDLKDSLHSCAKEIRNTLSNDKVYIRGIIEVSNHCICNCKFCGNAAYSKKIERYRLNYNEIVKSIDKAKTLNIGVIHFASGLDPYYDTDVLCGVIKYAKSKNIVVELALGHIDIEKCKRFYNSGAQRYIVKFESSNPNVYASNKICNDELSSLISFVKELKDIGYKVGTGNIIGLPGQKAESIVNDLILTKALDADMASTSVFTPNSESLLKDEPMGNIDRGLNYLALVRLIFPAKRISIPSNSTFGIEGKTYALKIAANELSFNMTPAKYKNNYSLYAGKSRYKSDLLALINHINKANMSLSDIKETVYG